MPIRKSHAHRVDPKDVRKVKVEYDGESMTVGYNIRAMSPTASDMLSSPARALPGMARLLADILTTWEVIDDDKQVVPITYEVLAEFPLAFVDAVASAIMDDVRVPKATSSSFTTG